MTDVDRATSSSESAQARVRPLRVLFLTAHPAIGGPLPKLAPLMVDGLRSVGCEVLVEGWSARRQDREPLPAKVLGRSFDLGRARARIHSWRPDVVYVATSHNWPTLLRDVPLALTTAGGGPPLVLHFHGSECGKLGQPGHGVFTSVSRWLAEHAAAVLLLSTEELETWSRFCPRARFEVVLNPFLPLNGAAPATLRASQVDTLTHPATLLFIGRLVHEKGVFELLDALSIVRRCRACKLMIAGIGPAESEVARHISLLGLSKDVELLGYISGDALDHAYKAADIFVLPSHREGFPMVVMEAMAYGLPVVTTPIRGCADHLIPGENALFAPPRDVEALAGQLLRLLDEGDLRRSMGTANREKVRDFAPDAVIPRYVEILRSVTQAGQEGVGRCER